MGIDSLLSLDERIFIIAEIGNNHEGDFGRAKELLHMAVDSGVDAVKYQTFNADQWFTESVPTFKRARKLGYKTQIERMKTLEFAVDQFVELHELAEKAGVEFMTSVFDLDSLDAMAPYLRVFKVSSAEMINVQLLSRIADIGKPVIISTGQAVKEEIDRSLSYFDINNVALLHCVSSYPTLVDDANLRSIQFLKDRYKTIVGYSDHTIGNLACISAAAMGARILEKHFTMDRTRDFGDHPLSATPQEMQQLVSDVRVVERMLGSKGKECGLCELESKQGLRKNLYVNKRVRAGEVLKEGMLIPLIGNAGVSASEYYNVLGIRVVRDMNKGDVLSKEDLEKA